MSALQPQSQHVVRIFVTDHNGMHDAGVTHVHRSRNCLNCIHDGAQDAEWQADGGVEKYGRCMNGCGAAEDPIEANQWCDSHATQQEWVAGVSRIDRPALGVVEGGAA